MAMFVRTVAPSLEKTSVNERAGATSPGEGTKMSVLNDSSASATAEESHREIPDPCDFQACQLYRVFRYPVIVMNVCGVFVPSYCICQHSRATRHDPGVRDGGRLAKSTSGSSNRMDDVEHNGSSSKSNSLFYAETSPLSGSRRLEEAGAIGAGEKQAAPCHKGEDKDVVVHVERCVANRSCKNSDRRWWGVAKRVGCVSMFTCHSVNSIRYAFILREASKETGHLVFSMAMFFILSTYFYLMAFNSYACRTHFTSFISSARKFELQFSGFKTNFTRLFRIHGVMFVIGFVNQSLNATIFMYGVLHSFGDVSPQMWPFKDLQGGWRLLLALVVGFSVFCAGANQYGANIFRAVITDVVEDEFKGLRKSLKSILSRAARLDSQTSPATAPANEAPPPADSSPMSTPLLQQQERTGLKLDVTSQYPGLSPPTHVPRVAESEVEFDRFMTRFRSVCDLLEQGYHLTKHTVAAAYVFGVPTLCVLVYGLVSSSVTRDQWVVLSLNVIVAGAVLAHTTWTLARLGTTAEAVCDVVYDAEWNGFSHSFLQKMVLFTTMFSKKRFGITVYGLFRIQWSTLLMIGSSLLVYSIVIIQFQLGAHNAICRFGNFTV